MSIEKTHQQSLKSFIKLIYSKQRRELTHNKISKLPLSDSQFTKQQQLQEFPVSIAQGKKNHLNSTAGKNHYPDTFSPFSSIPYSISFVATSMLKKNQEKNYNQRKNLFHLLDQNQSPNYIFILSFTHDENKITTGAASTHFYMW